MSRYAVGSRVGAISHSDGDTVYVFGYGVYEGDYVPSEDAGGVMAERLREAKITNPKISLDSGEVVWGCECWWGPEDAVKAKLAQFETVEMISITEARKRTRE